jgi:uncharacterized protein YjbI with pentapeptide repeats
MPPLPPTAAALANKAEDLQALRDAVVDAAGVSAGLWLSYLFVLLYLAIAVGGVAHRDLFLASPVRLPFLNVDLSLISFFMLGPGLFLIVHAYVLLHFVLLASKVGVFHAELVRQITDDDVRERLRGQLPSNVFVQFLAGTREMRTGVMGRMLRSIAQISLVAGPVALLVLFQVQFLPYHNEEITWLLRIAVVADLALLWTLWPSVERGETTRIALHDLRRGKVAVAALASLISVLLVFTVATFPGEWADDHLPNIRLIPTKWRPHWSTKDDWISLQELLLAGAPNEVTGRPRSLLSNRLVLTDQTFVEVGASRSLRGRNLREAVLNRVDLRKADFTGAILNGANFDRAKLQNARFGCADTGKRGCTWLQGSRFQFAELQGAVLDDAYLQGASLIGAQLQGASLKRAQLQGAVLFAAQLQGAVLDGAHLQGAMLPGAQLQGASLAGAKLQGALLDRLLEDGVQLQGASLRGAELQGSLLDGAHLQGAVLDDAHLQGAMLRNVLVWRLSWRDAEIDGTLIMGSESQPKYRGPACSPREETTCDWSRDSFMVLWRLINETVPEGPLRHAALQRIRRLDPEKPLEGEPQMTEAWKKVESSAPLRTVYEKSLAEQLRRTGCDSDGAPYVLQRLLQRFRLPPDELPELIPFQKGSPHLYNLAAAFLDEAHCPGARGLSDRDKSWLQLARTRASNQ